MQVRQLIKNLKRLGDPDAEVVFMGPAVVVRQRELAGFKEPISRVELTTVAIPIHHVLAVEDFQIDGQRFVILAKDPDS